MCQFALFRWETSVILSNVSSVPIILESQALRSLSYLSMNFLPPSPIRLKKKKKKMQTPWGELTQLLSLPITFFPQFPHPFFHSIWRSTLTDFKASPHSPPNFNLSLSFSPLVCCFHITLSAWTFLKPTLSEHVTSLLKSLKGWANGTAWGSSPPTYFSIFCILDSTSTVLKLLSQLTDGQTAGPGAVSQTRPCNGSAALDGMDGPLVWVCFVPLPPSTSTSLGIPALSPLITFLWPDHVQTSRVPWRLCPCFFFYSASSSLASSPTLAL